jgi:hypothetical protein
MTAHKGSGEMMAAAPQTRDSSTTTTAATQRYKWRRQSDGETAPATVQATTGATSEVRPQMAAARWCRRGSNRSGSWMHSYG